MNRKHAFQLGDVIKNLEDEVKRTKERMHALEAEKVMLNGLYVGWRAKCQILTEQLKKVTMSTGKKHDA